MVGSYGEPASERLSDAGNAVKSGRTGAGEHRRAFCKTVKRRTGCEGRISSLKRGYGWDRSKMDSTEGARIWIGKAVPTHNLVKIGRWPADESRTQNPRGLRTAAHRPPNRAADYFRRK
jgi:IS5 family transposase